LHSYDIYFNVRLLRVIAEEPKLVPYFAVLIFILLLVTYIPELSLGVPRMMGLI